MGSQIIKQPNGLYCRFSSITDRIEVWNATPEELIEDLISSFRESVTRQVKEIIEKLEAGEKPYYQFTMTFEEALKTSKRHSDPEEYKQVLKDTKR